jgi:hypothetical protein
MLLDHGIMGPQHFGMLLDFILIKVLEHYVVGFGKV